MPMEAWREVILGLHVVDKTRSILITKMDGNKGKKEGMEEGRKGWMDEYMDG